MTKDDGWKRIYYPIAVWDRILACHNTRQYVRLDVILHVSPSCCGCCISSRVFYSVISFVDQFILLSLFHAHTNLILFCLSAFCYARFHTHTYIS
jgi:hypothetical protein